MDRFYGAGWQVQRITSVPQRTLDEIAGGLPKVTILKIDVQGYERAVLSGATKTLGRCKYLVLEVTFRSHYEGDSGFPELHDVITDHGFLLRSFGQPFCRSGQALWVDAVYERIR